MSDNQHFLIVLAEHNSNLSKAKDFKNQPFKLQSLLWKELTSIDLSFSPQNFMLNVGYLSCHISRTFEPLTAV